MVNLDQSVLLGYGPSWCRSDQAAHGFHELRIRLSAYMAAIGRKGGQIGGKRRPKTYDESGAIQDQPRRPQKPAGKRRNPNHCLGISCKSTASAVAHMVSVPDALVNHLNSF